MNCLIIQKMDAQEGGRGGGVAWGRTTYFLLGEAYRFLTHNKVEGAWSLQIPGNFDNNK